jgi:hypothetical protein
MENCTDKNIICDTYARCDTEIPDKVLTECPVISGYYRLKKILEDEEHKSSYQTEAEADKKLLAFLQAAKSKRLEDEKKQEDKKPEYEDRDQSVPRIFKPPEWSFERIFHHK